MTLSVKEKQQLNGKAQRKARTHLRKKYRTEYKELYFAYLVNHSGSQELSDKEKTKLKVKATRYAEAFLVQEYKSEYQDVYRSFLINTGYYKPKKKLKDERKGA